MNSSENKKIIEIDSIIKTKRKTFSIKVVNGKIIVISPLWASDYDIDVVVKKHSRWIFKKLEQYDKKIAEKKEFINGEKFLFLGIEYPLNILDKPEYAFRFNEKTFFLAEDCRESALKYFEMFYKQKAKKILTERTLEIAKIMGVTVNDIKINSARTRWGSCSSRGSINFSFRLILAPIETVDSVIVHELAHRLEMNHSSKFYDIVEKTMPRYNEYQKWFEENSYKLSWI